MPPWFRQLRFAALASFLLATSMAVHAQTVAITGLYTTGVDNSNALLGGNALDAHYVVNASGGTYDGTSYTVRGNSIAAGWTSNTSSARWISTPVSGSSQNDPSRPNGIYDYTLTFTMPAGAQLNTVSISGIGAVDDTATILVNGALVSGQTINDYGSTNSFSLTSANASFNATTNTITFRSNNSGGGPTGMIITSLSGTVVVPEVGAFLPVVAAFALFAAIRVKRRQPAHA